MLDLHPLSAERQGFEPRVPRSTTVFKTAAIDHSATSPILNIIQNLINLLKAERQGFEPRVPRSTTVFKTAAIDHSATSPKLRYSLPKRFLSKAMQRYD